MLELNTTPSQSNISLTILQNTLFPKGVPNDITSMGAHNEIRVMALKEAETLLNTLSETQKHDLMMDDVNASMQLIANTLQYFNFTAAWSLVTQKLLTALNRSKTSIILEGVEPAYKNARTPFQAVVAFLITPSWLIEFRASKNKYINSRPQIILTPVPQIMRPKVTLTVLQKTLFPRGVPKDVTSMGAHNEIQETALKAAENILDSLNENQKHDLIMADVNASMQLIAYTFQYFNFTLVAWPFVTQKLLSGLSRTETDQLLAGVEPAYKSTRTASQTIVASFFTPQWLDKFKEKRESYAASQSQEVEASKSRPR